jgi:hypothetical protein
VFWLELDGVLVDVCLREIYVISIEADHLRRSTKRADIDLLYLLELVDSISTTVPLTSPILSCNERKAQRQISAALSKVERVLREANYEAMRSEGLWIVGKV